LEEYFRIPETSHQSLKEQPSQSIVVCIPEGSNETAKLAFLKKIFAAVGKPMEELSVLEMAVGGHKYDSPLRFEGYRYLFLFGVEPSDLGLQVAKRPYEVLRVHHSVIVCADDLDSLGGDSEKKRALWSCLQTIFSPS